MDKIKENPFWAAVGGAGILFLILFGVLVIPAWSAKGTLEKKIQSYRTTLQAAANSTPGEPDIFSWDDGKTETEEPQKEKDYAGILAASCVALAKHYAMYDLQLEWWMTRESKSEEELKKLSPSAVDDFRKPPVQGQFTTLLKDASASLEKLLQTKGVRLGLSRRAGSEEDSGLPSFGFNWETEVPWALFDKKEEREVLRRLQKRFWIRKRIAQVCAGAEIKVDRLVDVYFFERLSPRLRGQSRWELRPSVGSPKELPYPGVPLQGGISKYQETRLPGDLGATITFGVAVDLPYGQTPKFLSKLADRDLEPHLLLNIVGCRITLPERTEKDGGTYYQKRPVAKVTYNEAKLPADTKKAKTTAVKRFYDDQKPLSVRMLVTCRVLDFDPEKVPDWVRAHPALPAWAK